MSNFMFTTSRSISLTHTHGITKCDLAVAQDLKHGCSCRSSCERKVSDVLLYRSSQPAPMALGLCQRPSCSSSPLRKRELRWVGVKELP